MVWTSEHHAFAVETLFSRLVYLYLINRALYALISCYTGMMLFWIELSTLRSIDFLSVGSGLSYPSSNLG